MADRTDSITSEESFVPPDTVLFHPSHQSPLKWKSVISSFEEERTNGRRRQFHTIPASLKL